MNIIYSLVLTSPRLRRFILKRVGGFVFIDDLYLYTISVHTLVHINAWDFSYLIFSESYISKCCCIRFGWRYFSLKSTTFTWSVSDHHYQQPFIPAANEHKGKAKTLVKNSRIPITLSRVHFYFYKLKLNISPAMVRNIEIFWTEVMSTNYILTVVSV
jgi:hypothetical protein